jgi:hypothetical protein
MATSTFSSWSLVLLTAANIFNCTSSIFCCVDVSPLEPAALPSPLKSPPYTVERAVLPDIVFPPPGEGEIVEDILEQILPEDDRSVSRSDSFQAL